MCDFHGGVKNLTQVDQQQEEAVQLMDTSVAVPGFDPNASDESQRVKFLCSFSGTILPRPQDGKLRYVGGETRIVSVPRDIRYEDLMAKMRELFEGASVLKYQQPDEDLDALVSVVNDDDVANMMEEYEKSGTGDGFTRLRLFLFAHPEQDGCLLHFGDGDERENERRYVDALNSLNESPGMGSFDDIHAAEQYFNQMNLGNLTIPHLDSGQLQQAVNQRYNEMEAPWSPAYYSPRQHGNVDQRHVLEFSTSPSSSRYQMPYTEDYNRSSINAHSLYEHPAPYTDNLALAPPVCVVNEKAGFPGNILQAPNVYEGNSSVCDHCRMPYQRNPVYPDSSWKPGDQPHVEPSNAGNGYLHASSACAECPPNREAYLLNSDSNLPPQYYYRDQNDPRSLYTELHGQERGWVSPHPPPSPWADQEPIRHISVSGRLPDGYIVENGINIPLGHVNACDGLHVQSHYMHHDNPRFTRPGVEFGSQNFQEQALAPGSQVHPPSVEDRGGIRYGNPAYAFQGPHGHIHSAPVWRNPHSPMPGGPSYDTPVSNQLVNGSVPVGFIRGAVEVNSTVRPVLENQNPWGESLQKPLAFDGSPAMDYSLTLGKFAPVALEGHHPQQVEPIQSTASPLRPSISGNSLPMSVPTLLIDDKCSNVIDPEAGSRNDTESTMSVRVNENHSLEGGDEKSNGTVGKSSPVIENVDKRSDDAASSASIKSNAPEAVDDNSDSLKVHEVTPSISQKQPNVELDFLPELIESVKEKAVENLKEVKDKVQQETGLDSEQKDAAIENVENNKDGVDTNADLELDNDNDVDHSEIELTKAEAEALERGLQTIKNEDLEEIRELGSGTYGSVFHGKWKGSDVAIKRIKASCFAGKPSERERLIADFWKEALTLSSLHHPNVVSFYGVVRDGPDGSLATVTEFMVNGSLKQFLQKKDRTIDRRKRLIIAMDTAFGMEYLHGKNIVHFDLKCENLLVNMRDPHRPVCKVDW
ncbi:uncharacterized protein LOC127259737 isoform X2 [Andrographis paniculata]|uniref:uncharacterized protein LOC127259737 isoform X2 n=1 Tax=Andrographis paniculata TaxID=175694 RepID=UPI0021E7BC2F|nr:uncharacterized protein LOC127259737 isoform X2 [Andrographis paniculata]